MNGKSIHEVWPDRPPVCAGCGHEVDPKHATLSPDYKLYCGICERRRKKEEKEAKQEATVGG